jgi:hypothetical protein
VKDKYFSYWYLWCQLGSFSNDILKKLNQFSNNLI